MDSPSADITVLAKSFHHIVMKAADEILHAVTPAGTTYVTWPPPPSTSWRPTLLLFGTSGYSTLNEPAYHRLGDLLHARGWNIVSIDLPGQGGDVRSGEKPGWAAWSDRIRSGEDIVAAFRARVNDVIDHLVSDGLADPGCFVAAGTSYGGFMAIHAAAGNPGIGAVAAFDPILDIASMREFSAIRDLPLTQESTLIRRAKVLADRDIWLVISQGNTTVHAEQVAAFRHAVSAFKQKSDFACDVTRTAASAEGHGAVFDWPEEAAAWIRETVASTVRTLPTQEHPLAVPCMIYPPDKIDGCKTGLVIHMYGSGGSHTSHNLRRPAYAALRRELREAGYWVVVPELGPSHWMNARAAATLDAVINGMVADHEIDPGRVHLFGTSMGGGSSFVYARTRPNMFCSVCAIFPMTDFEAWVREAPAYLSPILQAHDLSVSDPGTALHAMSPLHNITDFIGTPVYILHGDSDEIVPVYHGQCFADVLRRAGGHVVYREIHGAGHNDDIAFGQHGEILSFIHGAEARNQPYTATNIGASQSMERMEN